MPTLQEMLSLLDRIERVASELARVNGELDELLARTHELARDPLV